jgi:hypothetical protein
LWLVGTAVVTALLVAIVARTRVDTGPLTTADLQVFWLSGGAIRTGHDPYLFWLPGAKMSLVYPPFAGMLMVPASLVPLAGLRILWFSCVILALDGVIWLTARWAGLRITWWLLLLSPAVLLIDPVWQELWSGQVNVFLVLLVIADLSRPDGARGKGIGVGLAAGIKLTPGLFIVYLALTERVSRGAHRTGHVRGHRRGGFVALPAGQAWRYWTGGASLRSSWDSREFSNTSGSTSRKTPSSTRSRNTVPSCTGSVSFFSDSSVADNRPPANTSASPCRAATEIHWATVGNINCESANASAASGALASLMCSPFCDVPAAVSVGGPPSRDRSRASPPGGNPARNGWSRYT